MTAATLTLADFLLARIAEDESVARAVIAMNHDERKRYAERGRRGPDDAETDFDFEGPVDGPSGWAAIYVGPARVLAECEAKRRIVEECAEFRRVADATAADAPLPQALAQAGVVQGLERAVAHLAFPYAEHPDYRQEWRP